MQKKTPEELAEVRRAVEAYRVPFHLDRRRAQVLGLVNRSAETVRWVRIETDGPGLASAPVTRRLAPGEGIEVVVRGRDLARGTRLVVHWQREDGEHYLWGVAL